MSGWRNKLTGILQVALLAPVAGADEGNGTDITNSTVLEHISIGGIELGSTSFTDEEGIVKHDVLAVIRGEMRMALSWRMRE